MRWGRGPQAALTARGRDQSDRFTEAHALLAAHYQVEVHVVANVILVQPPAPEKPQRRNKGQDENYTLCSCRRTRRNPRHRSLATSSL
jgi:hypothetical protein